MDSDIVEKALFLYESLRYDERKSDTVELPSSILWPEDGALHDLGLSKWIIVVDETAEDLIFFKIYTEEWEDVKINTKAQIFMLLEKYNNMVFHDEDEKKGECKGLFKIIPGNLEWRKREKGVVAGWRVLAKPLSLFDDETDEEELEAYFINKNLHKMIAAVDQSEFGFKLLIQDASGSKSSSSSSDDEDDEPSRIKSRCESRLAASDWS